MVKKVVLGGFLAAALLTSAAYASEVRTIREDGVAVSIEKIEDLPGDASSISSGHIVGFLRESQTSDKILERAYRYNIESGETEKLDIFDYSRAQAVNNRGDAFVVRNLGEEDKPDTDFYQQLFIWSKNGGVERLHRLEDAIDEYVREQVGEYYDPSIVLLEGVSINNSGEVVGQAIYKDYSAALWFTWKLDNHGEVTILESPRFFNENKPNHLSETGVISGLTAGISSMTAPVTWDRDGNVEKLSHLPGKAYGSRGAVVYGQLYDPAYVNIDHPVIWHGDGTHEFISTSFNRGGTVHTINADGNGIVSEWNNSSNVEPSVPATIHFYTKHKTLHDITDAIREENGTYPVTFSIGLNDNNVMFAGHDTNDGSGRQWKAFRVTVEK